MWGAISKDGLGPLVRLDGRFNAATYKDLLDTVMLPYALDGPFRDGVFFTNMTAAPSTLLHASLTSWRRGV